MFTSSWTALKALLVLSVVPSPPTSEVCQDPVFYCRIANSAHSVRLCERDDQLTYSFQSGRGVPEKTFSAARAAALVTPWNGFDDAYTDAISIPHGIWSYRLFAVTPRGADHPAGAGIASAGITVLRAGQDVRHFTCDADSVRERMHSLQAQP